MSWLRNQAEAIAKRYNLSYSDLLGARFAVNVAIAASIVWLGLAFIGGGNPIWGIASMVAASDPEPEQAKRVFKSRLINVVVGCATGLFFVLIFGGKGWVLPIALGATVLVSTYVVRVKTMWRQAPITAAVVIAATLVEGSVKAGMGDGLQRVAEVLFGCIVGLVVSVGMSKVWLIRPPAGTAQNLS